jgi:cytochrome c
MKLEGNGVMRLPLGLKILALAILLSTGSSVTAQQFGNPEPEPEIVRPPDLARGEQLFKECMKCHTIVPGEVKIGPSLAGVVGRRPGSVPDFGYSQDMINLGSSGIVWNEVNLDQFLTRPRSLVAGTKMVFQGFRRLADRDDVIAYLSTIRG